MKKIISGLFLVGAALAGSAQASNVVLGAAVTLNGTFGTDGWSSVPSAAGSTLTDGIVFPEQTQWDSGSVWWNGYQNPNNEAIINLGGLFSINSFLVQADDNDTYRIEYRVGNGSWQTAWDIPAPGGWGLTTSSSSITPIIADALRFTATGGDGYYSVSEIQAEGRAVVPVPAALPLFMSGFAAMGFAARRKSAV